MSSVLLALALTAGPANILCPVTGRPVTNHRLCHHVTVKGQKYYVFDQEAARRLRFCPSCYLNADGVPRNAETATHSPS